MSIFTVFTNWKTHFSDLYEMKWLLKCCFCLYRYTWKDLYTQCVLGNILLAYRMGLDAYDSTWCDKHPLTEQLSPETLQTLNRYDENS